MALPCGSKPMRRASSRSSLVSAPPSFATLQQVRQLHYVRSDPPSLIAREQVRRRSAAGLIFEIDVGERLPVGVADDEAGVGLLDGPGRREAALGQPS